MRDASRDAHLTTLTAVALLATYAATLSALPWHVFWLPDEGAKYLELQSVHWAGGVRYEVPFPARRIDPDFEFLPHEEIFPRPSIASDGSMHVPFKTAVLFPLVSRAPLRWFGLTGLYLLPLLSGWGIAIVSGALMSRVAPRWAPFAVLLVGLGTPVCFYSMVFWEHTVAGLLALLALYVVIASPRWRPASVLAVTAALTAAWTLRFEMLAFAAAIFLGWGISSLAASPGPTRGQGTSSVAYVSPSRWPLALLLAGLSTGFLLILHASLPPRHRWLLAHVPAQIADAFMELWHHPGGLVKVFVHSPISEGAPVSEEVAILVAFAVLLSFIAAFTRSVRAEAACILTSCAVVLGFGLFLLGTRQAYRSLHGVFPVAPFLIVWPYALRQAWRERSYVLLAVANVSLCYLGIGVLAIATTYLAEGELQVGMEWGQRYLLVLYPLLTIATLASLRSYQRSARPQWLRRAFSAAVGALMVVGVGLEIRGLTMLRDTREALSKWDAALRAEEAIVTDVWWLPSAVAVLYTEREMFFVQDRAHTARWVQLAGAHGVRNFTFASLNPVEAGELGTQAIRRAAERTVNGLYLTSFVLIEGGAPAAPG